MIFVSTRVALPDGVRPASVHVENGKIVHVRGPADVPAGAPVTDLGDLVLLPGLVDTHVHINDPGRTAWEGFDTATRAAAAGGVTTLVDMPLNSIPPTTTLAGLAAKAQAADGRLLVDVGFCGGLVPGSVGHLREIWDAGAIAFKCFLADSGVPEFSHVGEADLEAGMRELAGFGAPLFVHAELPGPLARAAAAQAAAGKLDPRAYASWLDSRPREAEDEAIDLVIRLSKDTGARAHVVHLSSATALSAIRRAKDAHAPFSAETCPHYLTFASEEIPEGATEYKCAPPIRESKNRDQLWDALRERLLDQVVTDHSPSTAELKCCGSGDFVAAWGGIASLQLGLAAVWTSARARGATMSDVADWMSAAPARLVGLADTKGRIAPGADADFAVWDPDADFVVDVTRLEHKNKVTPYHGRALRGRVLETWLRGEKIYDRGTFTTPPRGRWLRRGAGATSQRTGNGT